MKGVSPFCGITVSIMLSFSSAEYCYRRRRRTAHRRFRLVLSRLGIVLFNRDEDPNYGRDLRVRRH